MNDIFACERMDMQEFLEKSKLLFVRRLAVKPDAIAAALQMIANGVSTDFLQALWR